MTRRLRPLRRQDGFTMAAVMIGMLTVMGLSVAAFAAANGDIRLGQRSVEEKKAYAAAEAGVAYYLQKLAQDNDYWTKCTSDPSAPTPNPVNQRWNPRTAPTDPRRWRALPTSPGQEYAIELLPRAGRAECVVGDNTSMIDPEQGTLRIRSTGRARGVYRSVVSTLRRNGFLDFIYFTNFETSDPAQQQLSFPSSQWRNISIKRLNETAARTAPEPTVPATDTIEAWADQSGNPATNTPATCAQWLRSAGPLQPGRNVSGFYGAPDGRGTGFYDPDGGGALATDWYRTDRFGAAQDIQCSRIQFRGPDRVDGPFHSNDHICVSNTPSFGRPGKNDRIEYFGLHPDCSTSATFNGPQKTGANLATLGVPKSNATLRQTVFSRYIFRGRTEITLQGDKLAVTRADGTTETLSWPANGLVYVENDPTRVCQKFDILRPYPTANEDQGCGDAHVRGTYSKSLTIATKRDILATGDITAASGSDALLGLIGENYVRVKHEVASYPCDSGTAETSGAQTRTIEAAILSLSHVFTVDNYQCGDPRGDLKVLGAIAQLYRGPVGTSSGTTAVTGYNKIYTYDDRLKFRSPPYFITPVESAWRLLRTSEQSAATRPAS